jgi:hypothetical protein
MSFDVNAFMSCHITQGEPNGFADMLREFQKKELEGKLTYAKKGNKIDCEGCAPLCGRLRYGVLIGRLHSQSQLGSFRRWL